jgi:hypothetical protein
MADIEDTLRTAMHAAVDAEEAPHDLVRLVIRRHRRRNVLVACIAVLAVLALAVPAGIALLSARPASGSPQTSHHSTALPSPKRSAPAGQSPNIINNLDNPQVSAVDPATGTLYVLNDSEETTKTLGYVSVVDISTCDALHGSGCAAGICMPVGFGPTGMAVDQATDTIYVINSISSTVSVIKGATCNARNAAGCDGAVATVPVGQGAIALDVDQATNTVYVANWDNGSGTTMSVINGRTCNGQITSGCSQPPAQVSVGPAPDGVFVDQATDTVYVPTVSANGAAAVRVIDGATCNSATTSGCGRTPASVSIGTESVNETRGIRDRPRDRDPVCDQLCPQYHIDDQHGPLLRRRHLRLRPDSGHCSGRARSQWHRSQPGNPHRLCLQRHRQHSVSAGRCRLQRRHQVGLRQVPPAAHRDLPCGCYRRPGHRHHLRTQRRCLQRVGVQRSYLQCRSHHRLQLAPGPGFASRS